MNEPDDEQDDAYVQAMFAEWQLHKRNTWDDGAGYDLSDPKHPTWAERMADAADFNRDLARGK